ncbi:DUF2851 family protein [Adhaeribacter sp. BT258]|uniref:DUF2851 family protein n=1 Tax=Adhaeribacter terrigena TaxID=2793070 RepID=A0ABS1BYB0_9BACT|nr:DUF2851 family protein [Adhaeribacter terrigena]MBK0402136.1 DUF2851 family protein [Adhaeribacter terrigena]
MNEDFLAYLWKLQYFDKASLQTESGEPLSVLRTGMQNANAGPDFLDASLKIGEITWAGSVELHVKASDWHRHRHTTDKKYDQVILHVVWENDMPVLRTNGSEVPVLALQNRVSPALLQTYQQLKQSRLTIPCESFLPQISGLTKTAMLERVLLERLELKAERIRAMYYASGNNWEETAYAALLSGYGFKINQAGFEKLARQLPYKVLQKHRHQILQTEALLFGQAGFLTGNFSEDAYLEQLQKEFGYLTHKYNLPEPLQASDWNFLRLRPANFPTVRLAQLAALFTSQEHIFSFFLADHSIKDLEAFFVAKPSFYWENHYMPGRSGKIKVGAIGKSSINILLINIVAPLLVAYAHETGQLTLVEKALNLLEMLPPEKNQILTLYEALGFENKAASQSQGLLALSQNYCRPVRCLHCAIGNGILKRSKTAF